MACDKEILVLLSAHEDGEATPAEAAQAAVHLEKCAECRNRVEEWRGQRQMLEWAYTLEMPEECSIEDLAGKGRSMPVTANILRIPSLISLHPKWVKAGALVAAVLTAFAVYRFAILPPAISVGKTSSMAKHTQSARIEGGVSLKIGPYSVVRRIDERSIRLEKGWVTASVRHGSRLRILTERMEVLDQGTRFQVGTGSELDYVVVDEGSVTVLSGKASHRVSAGQIVTAGDHGELFIADLPNDDDDMEMSRSIGDVEQGLALRTGQELDWDQGLRRLAVEFPDVRLSGGVSGGIAWDTSKECGFYHADVVGLGKGLRAHFYEIAQVAGGGRIDSAGWEIPVALVQYIGESTAPRLPDDVYYLRLVPKGGTIVWRLTGSKGAQADFPFALMKQDGGAVDTSDGPVGWKSSTANNGSKMTRDEKLVLTCWPGDYKPSLKLRLSGTRLTESHQEENAMLAEMVKQVPRMKGVDLEHGDADLLYFHPGPKYRLLIAWNKEAGRELCRVSDMAAQGRSGSAIIGAISTDLPLGEPAARAGVYLLRFVSPDRSRTPYLEIVAPDLRPVEAWGAPSRRLPYDTGKDETARDSRASTSKVPAGQDGHDWSPKSLPGYGTVELSYYRMGADGQTFALGFQVIGRPDAKSTREIVRKGPGSAVTTSRSVPMEVWTEGSIRIRTGLQ